MLLILSYLSIKHDNLSGFSLYHADSTTYRILYEFFVNLISLPRGVSTPWEISVIYCNFCWQLLIYGIRPIPSQVYATYIMKMWLMTKMKTFTHLRDCHRYKQSSNQNFDKPRFRVKFLIFFCTQPIWMNDWD